MPKIEISMTMDEVNSDEVAESVKKTTKILSGSMSNDTEVETTEPVIPSSSKEENISTPKPMKHKKKKQESTEEEYSYEEEEDEESEEVTKKPKRKHRRKNTEDSTTTTTTAVPVTTHPMFVNDFSAHLVDLQESKFSRNLDDVFVNMVAQAKEFVRKYLSPDQWRRLKTLLNTIKEVGGSPYDVHRTATLFLSRTLSRNEMDQMRRQRAQLFRDFRRNYFNRNYIPGSN